MIKLIIDLLSFLYLNMKSIILLISITGFHRREQKVIWVPIAKNLGDIFFDKFITRYLLEFLQSFMNSFALATTRQLREHYNVLNLYFWHMHAKTQSLATREYVNLAVRQNKSSLSNWQTFKNRRKYTENIYKRVLVDFQYEKIFHWW